MAWPYQIERWRQYVVWESRDIPTDLILSIISHESGGQPGIMADRKCRSATIPSDTGEMITISYALGLMQVIPSHVNAWNQNKQPQITLEDMTGNDERSARLQIRLGSSIFASYIHKMNQYDPVEFPGQTPGGATPEQLKMALVSYAVGPGKKGGQKGLIPKLEQLKSMGRPLTLASLKQNFPRWGYSESKQKWINRPTKAATEFWNRYIAHSGQPNPALPGPVGPLPSPTPQPNRFDGWILPVVLIGSALFLGRKDLGLDKLFKK